MLQRRDKPIADQVWEELERLVGKDEKRLDRLRAAANFRLTFDQHKFRELGTRFCQRCGWRSGMSKYCYTCQECERCQFPRENCHCEDPELLKHVMDIIEETIAHDEEEKRKRARGY